MGLFRYTGFKRPKLTALQGAGSSNTLIGAPVAGNQIVIYDIIVAGSDGTQVIRDAAAGSIKIYCPDGHIGFTCPFPMGDGKLVRIEKSGDASTSFAITLVYSIEKI